MLMISKKILAILILCNCQIAISAPNCQKWDEKYSTKRQLFIGQIKLQVNNVFDLEKPDESQLIHKITNKMHIKTKKQVIQRQLLFKEGDVFRQSLLDESERLIRANAYIKDAEVNVTEVCANRVNISVKTTDTWTFAPGASYGRSGGDNKSGFEIQEHNLLGYGKSLTVFYDKNTDRSSSGIEYVDKQLFGSKQQLTAKSSNNSDGSDYKLRLTKPFYAFDTKNSWDIDLQDKSLEETFYQSGQEVDKFSVDSQQVLLSYGWSKPDNNEDKVTRFQVGWNFSRDKAVSLENRNNSELTTVSYPWSAYESLERNYIKLQNLRRMGVIEDTYIGKKYSLNLGLLTPSLGSDDNYLRIAGHYSDGEYKNNKHIGLFSADAISYIGSGNLKGSTLELKAEYFYLKNSKNTFYLSGKLQTSDNLKINEQFKIGSADGMRGYPTGFQSGNKAAIVSAEYRHFFDYYPYRLAKFGAIAFADVGTAWGTSESQKIIKDVGIGLRIVPTRSSTLKVIHLDLAFPLDGNDKTDSMQFNITTKSTF